MKHEDFNIGLVFMTGIGQRWRCTDVGERTIRAIELTPELDERRLAGSLYAIPEVSFDEHDILMAYRDENEAAGEVIAATDILTADRSGDGQISFLSLPLWVQRRGLDEPSGTNYSGTTGSTLLRVIRSVYFLLKSRKA